MGSDEPQRDFVHDTPSPLTGPERIADPSSAAGDVTRILSQIERGLRTPSAEILRSIGDALSIRTEILYERAGLLDRDDPPGVADAIDADDRLTPGQKQALMEVYRSFVDTEQEES